MPGAPNVVDGRRKGTLEEGVLDGFEGQSGREDEEAPEPIELVDGMQGVRFWHY